MFIYAYKNASKSVRALGLGGKFKVIRKENSKFQPTAGKKILNWGSSDGILREFIQKGCRVFNSPEAVSLCSDKNQFFGICGASVPPNTNNPRTALGWVERGELVVGRQLTRGYGGRGIIFSDDEESADEFRKCPLFTKYIPKASEFRVHVAFGDIIDIQQKKLRDVDDDGNKVDRNLVNWRVRSHSNGFIFARNDIEVPEDVKKQALDAFHSIPQLDFGAFDIIYNKKHDKAYVLECNTAPGLEGTTLDNYLRVFSNV